MNIYEKYSLICREASTDFIKFNTFKSEYDYRIILEHVNYQTGLEYLNIIKKENPWLLDKIEMFSKNDMIGSPMRFYYEELQITLSPTTLRYIKVLSDLLLHFDTLDGKKIVEIGGGYGGQCFITSMVSDFKSYKIVDLREASALQKKYLGFHNVPKITFETMDALADEEYDICISNYAFSEFSREIQNFYIERIINKAKAGYMTCNIFGNGNVASPLSENDIINLKAENSFVHVLAEEPLTGSNNFIYMWHE